nr:MAG TPA: hypothetical protein [Bacteriophage sp.]
MMLCELIHGINARAIQIERQNIESKAKHTQVGTVPTQASTAKIMGVQKYGAQAILETRAN